MIWIDMPMPDNCNACMFHDDITSGCIASGDPGFSIFGGLHEGECIEWEDWKRKITTEKDPRCPLKFDSMPPLIRGSFLTKEQVEKLKEPFKNLVSVVRCKDCKHGSLYCTEDVCGETLIECNRPDLGDVIEIHGWKWFCADGERR